MVDTDGTDSFVHYGVDLWVPELGGRIDAASDVQDLMMLLFGGLSKAERNRIKVRVRASMAAQAATEGRFLGGRPPYGYKLQGVAPHPHPAKAAAGMMLHTLAPDPATAPVVARIFDRYLSGLGYGAIAYELTSAGIPCSSAQDRKRNPHRSGLGWSRSAVRTTLMNPRYTGRQVWNRQRRDEVLIDVDDVALGHETRMRWNGSDKWIWSAEVVHEPIVSAGQFEEVQRRLGAGTRRVTETAKVRPTTSRTFVLRRRLRCRLCNRRMEAAWRHGSVYYLCRYRDGQNRPAGHMARAYVREDALLPHLDRWLAEVFDVDRLDATIDALTSAARDAEDELGATEQSARAEAEAVLLECDTELSACRAALRQWADAGVVAEWIRETQTRRLKAQQALATLGSTKESHSVSREGVCCRFG